MQYIIASEPTDGEHKGELPLWQAKCENLTPVSLYFDFSIFSFQ